MIPQHITTFPTTHAIIAQAIALPAPWKTPIQLIVQLASSKLGLMLLLRLAKGFLPVTRPPFTISPIIHAIFAPIVAYGVVCQQRASYLVKHALLMHG